MSNTERILAIVRRPSRDIAEAIVSKLAARAAELVRKPSLTTDELKELKRLRENARFYKV